MATSKFKIGDVVCIEAAKYDFWEIGIVCAVDCEELGCVHVKTSDEQTGPDADYVQESWLTKIGRI
jgi:hypothetical protein